MCASVSPPKRARCGEFRHRQSGCDRREREGDRLERVMQMRIVGNPQFSCRILPVRTRSAGTGQGCPGASRRMLRVDGGRVCCAKELGWRGRCSARYLRSSVAETKSSDSSARLSWPAWPGSSALSGPSNAPPPSRSRRRSPWRLALLTAVRRRPAPGPPGLMRELLREPTSKARDREMSFKARGAHEMVGLTRQSHGKRCDE